MQENKNDYVATVDVRALRDTGMVCTRVYASGVYARTDIGRGWRAAAKCPWGVEDSRGRGRGRMVSRGRTAGRRAVTAMFCNLN